MSRPRFTVPGLAAEPAARAYLAGCLVDDLGVAVSLWAMQLLQTDLMTDQRARASLAIPTLIAMIFGSLVAGKLSDGKTSDQGLLRRRHRVLLVGRVVETVILALLVVMVASGPVTVKRILPYVVVSGFMKTALRPARLAYAADVLTDEARISSLSAWMSQAKTVAVLGGLLAGGAILRAVHGRAWILFAFDVVTNLAFLGGLVVATRRREAQGPATTAPASPRVAGGALRFLVKGSGVLVATLFGAWLLEMAAELYDGRMIVRHVLGGSADAVRAYEIALTIAGIACVAAVPRVLRRVAPERLFVILLAVDAVVMMVAGRLAGAAMLVPFVGALTLDAGLTSAASVASDVVCIRETPRALRGRVQGIFQLVVLFSAIAAETVATIAADAKGIPWLVSAAGVGQAIVAVGIGIGAWVARRASTPPPPPAIKALRTSS